MMQVPELRNQAPGVRITNPPDRNPAFVMPSAGDLKQLYGIVVHRYPKLGSRSAQVAFGGFCRAFLRIGQLGREPLNDEYALESWVDEAVCWLRGNEMFPYSITAANFVAAIAAHGDIEFCPLDRFPYDCYTFGLRRDRLGQRATDAWRQVLGTGAPRSPVPPASSIRL